MPIEGKLSETMINGNTWEDITSGMRRTDARQETLQKNTFPVLNPPKSGSARRIGATFLPILFVNAGSMFALRLPTTKRTTL